eukprot:2667377-Rhodomonas_salina.2
MRELKLSLPQAPSLLPSESRHSSIHPSPPPSLPPSLSSSIPPFRLPSFHSSLLPSLTHPLALSFAEPLALAPSHSQLTLSLSLSLCCWSGAAVHSACAEKVSQTANFASNLILRLHGVPV